MKIGILGAGKIGTTVVAMLESSPFCKEIRWGDILASAPRPHASKTAYATIDLRNTAHLDSFVAAQDAVVSAAPFYLNLMIARVCAKHGVAYFDLTEDVKTTAAVRNLARQAEATFMPQCGLAPGAVNVIGGSLATRFERVRSLELRVGALPLYASNSMKYYLSWSTAGLINEYCQIAESLYDGRRIETLPLDGMERLTIDGTEYEAFNTSGGVATMCETFEGRIRDLNYKTIRYPGHCNLMKFLLQDLNLCRNPKVLTEILEQEVPSTEQDVVILYVNAVGFENDEIRQYSFVKKIYGDTIGKRSFSAIQMSTAAGVVAMLEIYANGGFDKGFVKQEDVPLDRFLATRWGDSVYGNLTECR